MNNNIKIGQIYLTHPKDQNFTTLYEEAISKQGRSVQLFVAIEIDEGGADLVKENRNESTKFVQKLINAFKKVYISAEEENENFFESALAQINTTVMRNASKNKIHWFGKLHIAIGALIGNELSVSVTGNARVYLNRKKDLTLLSDELSENETAKPTKIFANFSTGRLVQGDRIILSTNQIFNYLSLDRIHQFIQEETLEESCQEIIRALQDIKITGFSTFVFEMQSPRETAKPQTVKTENLNSFLRTSSASNGRAKSIGSKILRLLGIGALGLINFIYVLLKKIFQIVINFFQVRSKKYLFLAIGIMIIILLITIGTTFFKNISNKKQAQQVQVIVQAQTKLDDAEAALIFKDMEKVTNLVSETQQLLSSISQIGAQSPEYQETENRLVVLQNKLKKQITIESPILLTNFSGMPTNLLHSPNGFLAFNRNSGTIAFYDFRTGETKTLLENLNTSGLMLGDFVGGNHGYIFLNRDGNFQKLSISTNELLSYEEGQSTVLDMSSVKAAALDVFGLGNSARIYLIDTDNNQIIRYQVQENGISAGTNWLKDNNENTSSSIDISVDGNVYLLYSDKLEKYFGGKKQSFALQDTLPNLTDAKGLFTSEDHEFLYILDPQNDRIVVYDKNGQFINQLVSEKFRDVSDIYVDENSRIIYTLSGSELLQMAY